MSILVMLLLFGVSHNTELKRRKSKIGLGVMQETRPSWDQYFIRIADFTSQRSNCLKRKVGAIIVQDNKIVASGYNGTPRGIVNCFDGGCPRCNDSTVESGTRLMDCICLHAEENAILQIGAAGCEGATLYCNTYPCRGCVKRIIQVGIRRVVYLNEYKPDDFAVDLLKQAKISVEKML